MLVEEWVKEGSESGKQAVMVSSPVPGGISDMS